LISSSSPDELALISAAKKYGIKFIERNQYNELIIENDHHQRSQLYKFELLNVIEYNSERKRMTVIVKAPNGEIKILCKGADSILCSLLADTWEN
jgi:magnesium-transporting ATPase (P-type)